MQNPSFGSNAITAIYEDDKGNIWIGADPGADSPEGALIKYDRKQIHLFILKYFYKVWWYLYNLRR